MPSRNYYIHVMLPAFCHATQYLCLTVSTRIRIPTSILPAFACLQVSRACHGAPSACCQERALSLRVLCVHSTRRSDVRRIIDTVTSVHTISLPVLVMHVSEVCNISGPQLAVTQHQLPQAKLLRHAAARVHLHFLNLWNRCPTPRICMAISDRGCACLCPRVTYVRYRT